MSIATALSYMYPSAIAGLDYVLMNDGDGDYISEWNLTDIKPTNEQIKAAEIGHLECEAWSAYKAKAQDLLDKTDIVCLRCHKAGVAYPADWQKPLDDRTIYKTWLSTGFPDDNFHISYFLLISKILIFTLPILWKKLPITICAPTNGNISTVNRRPSTASPINSSLSVKTADTA